MSGRRLGSLPPVNVLPLRRCAVVGFGCEACFTTKFNENVEITALAIISTPIPWTYTRIKFRDIVLDALIANGVCTRETAFTASL